VPYFQAEENFYGETPGLGLGLAIVAILVVSAGGVCRSKNREEGRGLIVELELPTRRLSPIPSG
jgi:K+-sensing histidine kinase KdpD